MEANRHHIRDFSIGLYYAHEAVGISSVSDLAHYREGILHPDDFGVNIWNALGSLRMFADRFYCFLDSEGAFDLFCYVGFLLQSLVTLSPNPPAELRHLTPDSEPAFDSVVATCTEESQSRIVVQERNQNLSVSYVNPMGHAPATPSSPYFQGVLIPKPLWCREAARVLDDYFAIAARELLHETHPILTPWIRGWESNRIWCARY